MTITYSDIIEARERAMNDGRSVDRVFMTEESMDSILEDENFEQAIDTGDDQGDGTGLYMAMSMPVEEGSIDAIIAEDGYKYRINSE